MKRTILVAVAILAVPIVVLGYGYWFGRTHGSLYAYVTDVSDRGHTRPVSPVTLVFLDEEGRTLAEAGATDAIGTVYLTSPATYACRDVEQRAPFSIEARNEWDQCFERQSRWIPTWIRRARSVDLRSGSCALHSIPVTVSEHPDTWWLWWVPLRHIGGKPYTSFNVSIQLDLTACAAGSEMRR